MEGCPDARAAGADRAAYCGVYVPDKVYLAMGDRVIRTPPCIFLIAILYTKYTG